MDYKECLDYLFSQLPMYQRIGKAAYKADLSTTIAFDEILGSPHQDFKSIHIAGTNGKGSTSHMLASIMMEAGFKTGLYTSPHLIDFRERIKVNGQMIPESAVVNFVDRYRQDTLNLSPSFFEWTVALAFDHFRNERVDIAIIETGMGGRLDSTNIVSPELSVITNIGLDHQQFLGDTKEKIAAEKAGIMKEGVPVLIGEGQEELSNVFNQFAERAGSSIQYSRKTDRTLPTDLRAKYQEINVRTSLNAIDILKKEGWQISESAIELGLLKVVENTGLLGRWQVLQHSPKVICDVGHNEDGVREILSQLEREKFDKLHFVWGMVNDKQIDKILEMLPKEHTEYYFCQAKIPRSLDVHELAIEASKLGISGSEHRSVEEAFMRAKSSSKSSDLIFIGGSTFVVADALSFLST